MIGVASEGGIVEALQIVKDSTAIDDMSVRLFQNDLIPSPTTVIGDLTVATYTGYANQTAGSLGAPYKDALGNAIQEYDAVYFGATGSAIGNVVYGYYLVGGTGVLAGKLLAVVRFDEPVTMAAVGDVVLVQPRFALGLPIGVHG